MPSIIQLFHVCSERCGRAVPPAVTFCGERSANLMRTEYWRVDEP